MIDLEHINAVITRYARLNRVRTYAVENIHRSICVKDMAEIAYLETKYFSTYFKKKTGARVTDWVRALRIQKAVWLLCKSDRSISEVSLNVGFQDIRTFERAFLKTVGKSARDFKKAVEEDIRRPKQNSNISTQSANA